MDRARHWDEVYGTRHLDELSWFERRPALSLDLIERLVPSRAAGIVDVGGGASSLVDELLAVGYADVTVLDISQAALDLACGRLGALEDRGGHAASGVRWVCGDVTTWEPGRRFDLWHDRAVFHFLVDPEDRARYRNVLVRALEPGGHAVVATFADDGPTTCSGLPVHRYGAEALAGELGPAFDLVEGRRELHTTPGGTIQPFTWVVLRRRQPNVKS